VKKRLILIAAVSVLTIGADQGTKQLARAKLQKNPPVKVLDCCLALEYHENPGMAFGIGRNWPGGRFIMIGIGLVALYLVWRLVRDVHHRQKVADVAFGLVAGGAIGNLADRVYIGRVVDFVVMHWQRKAQWPAYNVADAALVFGVALMIFALGRKPDEEQKADGKKADGKKADAKRSKSKRKKGADKKR